MHAVLLRTHPLFQSLQPLVAVATVLVAAAATFALSGSDQAVGPDWSRVADLGAGVLDDASWLLPSLLSANLAFIAVLFAQAVTNVDANVMAKTRAIATAGSCLVGGSAIAIGMLSMAALGRNGTAAQLFAVVILVGLVVGLTLWMTILFFGTPTAQLLLVKELHKSTQAVVDRVRSGVRAPAWSVWVLNVAAVAVASIVFYLGCTLAADQPIPNLGGAIALLVVLSSFTSFSVVLAEIALSELPGRGSRQMARVLLFLSLYGPLLLAATSLISAGFQAAGLASSATILLPLLSAWGPWNGKVGPWTLRGFCDSSTRARLLKRLEVLQQRMYELQKGTSQLLLP